MPPFKKKMPIVHISIQLLKSL